jgi:hypothetical protein
LKKEPVEPDDILAKVKKQVEEYLSQTADARISSEKCRDYKDHKQWTAEEVAKLTGRNQAPIVVNRVKPKVDGLLGLLAIRKTDPKAYPRTQKHEKSSEAITDALRYVTDKNHFQDCKMEVAENVFVEGYGGAITDVKSKGDDIEIHISEIPWDRIFFDPYSRKKDFSDARFMGQLMWMDAEQAQDMFPDADINEIIESAPVELGDTTQDKPQWVDKTRKRVRIAQHFYIEKGTWMLCYHSGEQFLVEPMESPYLDDEGEPCNPIELAAAYIDRQNNRYGEVLGFIDQQDEINHRRSKALHLLSQRQTAARNNAIRDIAALKRELAKPNGHVAYDGDKGDFEILQTGDMAKGQFELYQDAKAELDAVSFNAQLSGDRQQGDLSGVAINKLQQAGTMELNGLFSTLNSWEKRIYRQIWARIKQFWTEEKWIRVTDDVDNLRWVGLNTQVTMGDFLEEKINDKTTHEWERKRYAAVYTAMTQSNDPHLDQVIDIKNAVPELDVDIILEQSFDVVNIQQEQFELLAKLAQTPNSGIDPLELIRLSGLRGKEEVIKRIEKSREEAAQAQGGAQQMQMQGMQAEVQKKSADAQLSQQNAIGKNIENTILANSPPDMRPQVNV